jgi:hypothetical protein
MTYLLKKKWRLIGFFCLANSTAHLLKKDQRFAILLNRDTCKTRNVAKLSPQAVLLLLHNSSPFWLIFIRRIGLESKPITYLESAWKTESGYVCFKVFCRRFFSSKIPSWSPSGFSQKKGTERKVRFNGSIIYPFVL